MPEAKTSQIIYSSDLHGDLDLYSELFALVENAGAEALILGGDLMPRDGVFYGITESQREFIFGHLNPAFAALRRRLPNLRVYLMMGNVDWAVNMDALEAAESEGLYSLLHMRSHGLTNGWFIAGYSCVPPTPFVIKDWDRRDLADRPGPIGRLYHGSSNLPNSIEEDLQILAGLSDPRRTVYVMHAPPHATYLDSLSDHRAIGSLAIRRFIEKHQPPLTLHGHIHESPSVTGYYWDQLGRTLSINPGQNTWRAGAARLHAVGFNLEAPRETLWHTLYGSARMSAPTTTKNRSGNLHR